MKWESYSSEDGSRKLTDFSYLLQRKWLRMMRRLYKHRFETSGLFTNYKKQVRQMSYDEMRHLIWKFIEIEFDYLVPYREYIDFIQLEESLRTLILCDRYNKKEPIIANLDFEVVRNALNKFNTRNLLNLFSEKSYALLFVHYFEKYGENDAHQQSDVDPARLLEEMKLLYDEADKYMSLTWDRFKQEHDMEKPSSMVFNFDDDYQHPLY